MNFKKQIFCLLFSTVTLSACGSLSQRDKNFLFCDGHRAPNEIDVIDAANGKDAAGLGFPSFNYTRISSYAKYLPTTSRAACRDALSEPLLKDLPGRELSVRISSAASLIVTNDLEQAQEQLASARKIAEARGFDEPKRSVFSTIELLEALAQFPKDIDPFLNWTKSRQYSGTAHQFAAEQFSRINALGKPKVKEMLENWVKLSPEALTYRLLARRNSRDYKGAIQDYSTLVSLEHRSFLVPEPSGFGTLLEVAKKPIDLVFGENPYKDVNVFVRNHMALIEAYIGNLEEAEQLIDGLKERKVKKSKSFINGVTNANFGFNNKLWLTTAFLRLKQGDKEGAWAQIDKIRKSYESESSAQKALFIFGRLEPIFEDVGMEFKNAFTDEEEKAVLEKMFKDYQPVVSKFVDVFREVVVEKGGLGSLSNSRTYSKSLRSFLAYSGLLDIREIRKESFSDYARMRFKSLEDDKVEISISDWDLKRIQAEEILMFHGAHAAIRKGYKGLIVEERFSKPKRPLGGKAIPFPQRFIPTSNLFVTEIELTFRFVNDLSGDGVLDAELLMQDLQSYAFIEELFES